MKEQIKTQEKELNKMETSNLSDAEVKTLVIRMLKEISEDLNSIKNIQSETKDTLIEIKNNLEGNKNRVDEPRIKSMILNIKKQKTTIQNNKKKKESKSMKMYKQPLGQLQEVQHLHHSYARRRRERARIWKSI